MITRQGDAPPYTTTRDSTGGRLVNALYRYRRRMPRSRAGDQPDPLEDLVAGLDVGAVRGLLVSAAEAHEDVARSVRLAAATDDERLGVLRTEVDAGLRTRRHLGYRESSGWASDAGPMVDSLAEAVATGPSRELVELLERAIGHVVKVILRADDSHGMIGDLARRLLDLHAEACDAGVADPVRLARWMVRFSFIDQDFFFVDPVRYADALGEAGLAAYRREADQRSAVSAGFAARHATERLAVLDGDVDRIIELMGGDLSAPHQFIQIAEAMGEIGRSDDVLSWARRGIAETSGWQLGRLYDLAAEVLADCGDGDGLLALRRDQHARMASASTYGLLRETAVVVGAWDVERAAARSVLAERDRGGLVDALLADGDIDEAWAAATRGEDWDPGGHRWWRLAEAREPTDPAAAMAVYLRVVDETLQTADRRAYRAAVRQLEAARRAADAAGERDRFDHHLEALRERYRRRPTMIKQLDQAGLH